MKTADLNHRCMRLPSGTRARLPYPGGSLALVVLALLAASPAIGQDLSSPSRGRRFEGGGPVDVDQLARRSTLIVHGTVSSSEAKWVGRVIYTHYALVVQETIRGNAQSQVVMAVPGGALGNVQLAIPGAPSISVGDELVLFGEPLQGQSSFTPVGVFAGVVPVSAEPGSGKRSVSPRGVAEDLDAFLEDVRSRSRR